MNSNETRHGYFMEFRIDQEKGEMQLMDASPQIQSPFQEKQPLTPVVQAMKLITETPCDGQEHSFLVNIRCDGTLLRLNLYRSDDYSSMVNVPRELLERLLREELTPRETEVAILLFGGSTIRAIASQLVIAEGTVKRMIYNIYQKLGVSSQVKLIREIYARLAQAGHSRQSMLGPGDG